MPKILFVHNHLSSFVKTDLNLLQERYVVSEWFQNSRFVNVPRLAHRVTNADLMFGWFASWHTFFPVLLARSLGKPSILVVGGYDTANMPEIGYGSMRGGFKRWIARATMQRATRVIAFSEASRTEAIANAGLERDTTDMIYLGVPAVPQTDVSKESLVITIGNVDRNNLARKGLEPFVRAAAYAPDVPFVVVGAWRDDAVAYLKNIASPNVEFTGWVEETRLQDYMARAKVYVQASRHEGFGMAVAEAMLCECIPVVTRAGSLPEVVGDTGVYAESTAPDALARAIQQALTLAAGWGQRARERIIQEFPLERRRQSLFQLIDAITEFGRY